MPAMNYFLINLKITSNLKIRDCLYYFNIQYAGGGTFILIIFINLHSFSNRTILHEENNLLNLKVLTLLQQ
jgi:hypothetical protein